LEYPVVVEIGVAVEVEVGHAAKTHCSRQVEVGDMWIWIGASVDNGLVYDAKAKNVKAGCNTLPTN
jgi:hypothetical protein